MKKIFMMAVMAVAALSANAQNEQGQVTLMPTVGLNVSGITNAADYKAKAGFVGGAVVEYGVSDNFGISGGVLFSMQGAKEKDGNKDTYKLNYLNIPIMANYYVYKGLAVKAGVQPGFLLSAKDGDESVKDECKKFDFAIPVGVSYEISKFVIDARYNIGLTKISKDSDDKSRNSVFQFTVGYKFAL